jgi:hypothetical protein
LPFAQISARDLDVAFLGRLTAAHLLPGDQFEPDAM